MPLHAAPCRSPPLPAAPCRSPPLPAAPCRSPPLPAAPCRSMPLLLLLLEGETQTPSPAPGRCTLFQPRTDEYRPVSPLYAPRVHKPFLHAQWSQVVLVSRTVR
uniref:Uncharacterized protein n=1 Tax=Knipowitschia caucasica TaxID=637954 RepID=A0AAV2MFS1_KNICA